MKSGKLPWHKLSGLLRTSTGARDDAVLLGPAPGEDAAVTEIGDQALVAASDPVTFATTRLGWYAVHINANDVAASGAEPRWFLATLLVPVRTTEAEVREIFSQIDAACTQLGVAVIGGHTEVTAAVRQPLVSGTMLGLAAPDGIRRTGAARRGDVLLLTKGACIEGAALLALEHASEARRLLGARAWKKVCAYLDRPGISILPEARMARDHPGVHALHDPTEGGICAGVYEMARASGIGVELRADSIPITPEAEQLCRHFNMDPLRTLSSGALLIAVAGEQADRLRARLAAARLPAADIGRLGGRERVLLRDGQRIPLTANLARDEIARHDDDGRERPPFTLQRAKENS